MQDGFSHLLTYEILFLIRSLYPMHMVNVVVHISLSMPQGRVTEYFIFCSLLLFIYCLQNKNKEIYWYHKRVESEKLTGFIPQFYFLKSTSKKRSIIFIGYKSTITMVIVFIISLVHCSKVGSKPLLIYPWAKEHSAALCSVNALSVSVSPFVLISFHCL